MDFYYLPPSPPCRAVMLVARALNIQLNLKLINTLVGEQFTPKFIKLNPRHTIPVIDDDGFVISESRAIMEYFVDKYARDDSLCPKDPQKKARVHQMLQFDATTLYAAFFAYFAPAMLENKPPSEDAMKKMEEGMGFFDSFLEGRSWASGDIITIADYSLAVTVACNEAMGINVSKYPRVDAWFSKAKTAIPGFDEINNDASQMFKESIIAKQKKE